MPRERFEVNHGQEARCRIESDGLSRYAVLFCWSPCLIGLDDAQATIAASWTDGRARVDRGELAMYAIHPKSHGRRPASAAASWTNPWEPSRLVTCEKLATYSVQDKNRRARAH